MPSIHSRYVAAAVTEAVSILSDHTTRDWQVPAAGLEWSCWKTAAHIAHDLLAYAGQVAGRPDNQYLPFDLVVRDAATPEQLLTIVSACGGLLSGTLAASTPDTRAWHWGLSDPSGFAAMGMAEALLHTHDITRGFGVDWTPPEDLCAIVLDRLVPDVPDGDPARVLLWATGRGGLAEHPPVTSWHWHAAVT